MSNFIEINETAPANPYTSAPESSRKAQAVSRSLQNAPGGYEVDAAGNVTQKQTVTTSQPIINGQEGDVLKSARSPHGSPVEVINDDTVVEINGVTATARSAARAGLLQKNPDGSYSEVAKAKAQAPGKAPKRVDPLSSDSRARVRTLENLVGPQNAQNIMHRVASAAGRGEGLDSISKELADLGGVQPEATKAIVEGVASDLDNRMTHQLINGVGMTQPQAEAMLDWCYQNLPKQHVSSMFSGTLHGDTGALSSAFEKYRLSARKAVQSVQ